nr:hypothetical protein [Tanacetum cinerariifolium]
DQQDESRSKYKVLDQEGCRSVQRIHVRNSEAFEDTENLPQPGELCWRTRQRGRLQTFEAWQSAPASDHSKSKRIIESRAKRSSKIISLGHDSTLLASSYAVKSKAYFKSHTHYPCVGFNSLAHSLRALSALRRFSLRTTSTAAKPCQGDSLEFYLITGRIPTVAAAGQKGRQFTTPCPLFKLIIDDSKKTYNTASATLMYAVMIQDRDQQDESRSKYKVLDQEGCRSVQRIHVRNSEAFEDTENLPQPGELCWRTRQRGRLQTFEAWQSAPASDHSKSKRIIESRAKRSSKIISLGHDSTLLASSYAVKSKAYFKSHTHYPCVGFNSLAHSLRALSALRRFSLRTTSTAAKPCQGDSLEFYLITGRIPTVAAAGQKGRQFTTPCPLFKLIIDDSKKTYNTASATLMYAVMIQDRVSMRVRMSQPHKRAMYHNKDD